MAPRPRHRCDRRRIVGWCAIEFGRGAVRESASTCHRPWHRHRRHLGGNPRRPHRRRLAQRRDRLAWNVSHVRDCVRHHRGLGSVRAARRNRKHDIGLPRHPARAPRTVRPLSAASARGMPWVPLVLRVLRGMGGPRRRTVAAAVLVLVGAHRRIRIGRTSWHRRNPRRRRMDGQGRRAHGAPDRTRHRVHRSRDAGRLPVEHGCHAGMPCPVRCRSVRRPSGQPEHCPGDRPDRACAVQQCLHARLLHRRHSRHRVRRCRRRVVRMARHDRRRRRRHRARHHHHHRRSPGGTL